MYSIIHHGAVSGVTGSCHQFKLYSGESLLVDCGMFQGAEAEARINESGDVDLTVDFDLSGVKALLVTHCHIDHVGRIPYLLMAGFKGPIYATQATAQLLPLVLEDALKVGVTRDRKLIDTFLRLLKRQLVAVPYKQWFAVEGMVGVQARFQVAGHILGSAYVELDVKQNAERKRVVFSGDLGAPYSPLLPAPKSPWRCDELIIESTYGDRLHEGRRQRRLALRRAIERSLQDGGAVLIPAFSIGRTQELLYELEDIIHRSASRSQAKAALWQSLDIIVDSPLASQFTAHYRSLKSLWDAEARQRVNRGRHPLSFEQLTTVDSHREHEKMVRYLRDSGKPAIVIAASGMCAGGRIQNYLEALLPDARTDVVFVGYQAVGTPGRDIQKYGPRGGYVQLGGQRVEIRAQVHTLGGYSAHADQKDLLNFVRRMRGKPQKIRIVHGDDEAKQALAAEYRRLLPGVEVVIPVG
ncbi:MBL fold metallo-hydrolase RNA specificity domain-containing protein [Thalassolituus marinus]|uniref:MBL fold metallo-hydrolase n=1 Tax=Thalassolituus marinus TaxID=671053 RepID=A0ABS7ZUD7_9GAMM|nr:MBL fold metallo-hydrolase [Thalassolituus marinus]MCA6064833.1 MBL fold metallo-hydrolase [Thalassolituus marinus]